MAYTVAFDAAGLIKGLHQKLEAAIAQAVQTTAITAQVSWQQAVMQTPGIWQPIRDRYAGSIQVEYNPGGMGARIYSDDPMATPIETGIPARDLKRMLDTSHKVRVTKTGQRYLIIPMRHNVPGNNALAGAMPESVYAQAKDLAKSKITGQISMRSGLNASDVRTRGPLMTMRNTYKWGERLAGPDVAKRFQGMYRFDTSSGKQNSSSYMTFRVMMEGSSGWIVPAKPGTFIVKGVAEHAQIMLKEEVTAAIASVS